MAENYNFSYVDVKEELCQALKRELPKHNFSNVKVLKSDPQSPTEIPCVGINRISDDETEQSIADFYETNYNRDTKTYTTVRGTFFSEAMEIRIWHANADERDKLYQTVKAVLFAIRETLVGKGLVNLHLRSGRDEQDSSLVNAPIVLYWATITMTYLNPLNVEVVQTADPITHIVPNLTVTTEGE